MLSMVSATDLPGDGAPPSPADAGFHGAMLSAARLLSAPAGGAAPEALALAWLARSDRGTWLLFFCAQRSKAQRSHALAAAGARRGGL